jgi:hypothetical protein
MKALANEGPSIDGIGKSHGISPCIPPLPPNPWRSPDGYGKPSPSAAGPVHYLLEKPKARPSISRAVPKVQQEAKAYRGRARASVAVAAFVMTIALALLGLLLSHLASGVAILIGSNERDGWLMAIGIDLAFVALELAMPCLWHWPKKGLPWPATPYLPSLLGHPSHDEWFCLRSHAQGLMIYPAIGLGFAVPALVYALTRAGATMFLQT